MRRYHLFPVLTFLAGLAVGIFSTGGYGKSPEPAESSTTPDVAGTLNGSEGAESTGSSVEMGPQFAALSATAEEASPVTAATSASAPELESRLQAMSIARARLQTEMDRLRDRVEEVERRLAASTSAPEATSQSAERPSRPTTPGDRRAALEAVGVAEERAADLVWRQGQQALDRLDLRDIATREGWFGSDRYRDELGQIEEDAVDMRIEIGDNFYDRYLFETGEVNRVSIDSIIPGSTAEQAGLQPGDLIEMYGDARVFRFEDLSTATSQGERGDLVPVQIRRGDGIVEIWLPRGPLGVRMDRARVNPDA